jgi:hypothetical protein
MNIELCKHCLHNSGMAGTYFEITDFVFMHMTAIPKNLKGNALRII